MKEIGKLEVLRQLSPDRRRVPVGERYQEAKGLWDQHEEILRRLVIGQKPGDIAVDLGITTQTVSNVRNGRLGKKLLEALHAARNNEVKDIGKELKVLLPRAVKVLENLLNGDDVKYETQAKVAFGLLDRTGYGPIHAQVNVNGAAITTQAIEELKKRAKLASIVPSGDEVEDANFVEISEKVGMEE